MQTPSNSANQPNMLNFWYLPLRIFVAGCGLLLLLGILVAQGAPGLTYDHEPIPPLNERLLDIVPLLIYASLLLTPHRWMVRGWFFYIKLILLLLFSLWLIGTGIDGISAYHDGGKDPLIVPTSFGFFLLAIGAPVSLILKKLQIENSTKNLNHVRWENNS